MSLREIVRIALVALVFMLPLTPKAQLAINVLKPEEKASKVLVKTTVRNTFAEPVQSARVTLFLFDQDNKVIGHETRWIIGGGEKIKKPLEPGKETVYYFVFTTDKPFSRSELRVNQVILKGGKSVPPKDAYILE